MGNGGDGVRSSSELQERVKLARNSDSVDTLMARLSTGPRGPGRV